MQTIVCHNAKGGTAKTSTAIHLAAAYSRKRKRVLLVDMDPQASLTVWLGVENPSNGLLLRQSLEKARPLTTESTGFAEIAPAGDEMALINQLDPPALRRALELTAKDFDICIIDNPPSLGPLAWAGLTAAQGVVIPCECSFLGLSGLAQFERILEAAKDLNPSLRLAGVLPVRFTRTNDSREALDQLRERYGKDLLEPVPESVVMRQAASSGKTAFDIKHKHPVCIAYEEAAWTIARRLRK